MVNLRDLEKWRAFTGDNTSMVLAGKARRQVTLKLNAPVETLVYATVVEQATGELGTYFVGVAYGYTEIQFTAHGDVEVTVSQPGALVYTSEFDKTSMKAPDPRIFTKMATRRTRNPELERIVHEMNRNLDARMGAQFTQLERQIRAEQVAAAKAQQEPKPKQKKDEADVSRGDKKEAAGDDSGDGKQAKGGAKRDPASGDAAGKGNKGTSD